jgi:uncharacterized protein YjeT (DUF2065 family)
VDWQDFWTALALMLVLEGVLPFLSPGNWRRAMASVIASSDTALRIGGLGAMLAGVVLLTLVR